MDEVGDAKSGEASLAAPRPSRSAGSKSLLIEDVRDLGIDVIVEKLVDKMDYRRRCFDLLRGRLGVQRRQSFCLATLEPRMDLGDPFYRQFNQRSILDYVGK